MRTLPHASCLAVLACLASLASAPAGPYGSSFYGDPPDDHHPWAIHDGNRPQPKVVTPGTFSSADQPGRPPSDAIVLFDGTDLSHWEANEGEGKPTKWIIKDGAMECVPGSGYVRTKDKFGDCQLHVEWAAPSNVKGDSQGRGNSGVFLMSRVEVQVLDNVNNPTYADGFAASVYGVNPPQANALRKPGEFQVYDIVFRRPIYKDGKEVDPGYVTVFENGVLVQDHTRLEGETGHMRRSKPAPFPETAPLQLQDHGNPVRYRNIWYRPLPPRPVEGGTDGYLTTEATRAKRQEIAAALREEAAKHKGGNQEMLGWAESLVYAPDETASSKVNTLAAQYVESVKALPANQLADKKDEVRHIRDVFGYLIRAKAVPSDFAPKAELDQLIKQQNWDKKR